MGTEMTEAKVETVKVEATEAKAEVQKTYKSHPKDYSNVTPPRDIFPFVKEEEIEGGKTETPKTLKAPKAPKTLKAPKAPKKAMRKSKGSEKSAKTTAPVEASKLDGEKPYRKLIDFVRKTVSGKNGWDLKERANCFSLFNGPTRVLGVFRTSRVYSVENSSGFSTSQKNYRKFTEEEIKKRHLNRVVGLLTTKDYNEAEIFVQRIILHSEKTETPKAAKKMVKKEAKKETRKVTKKQAEKEIKK